MIRQAISRLVSLPQNSRRVSPHSQRQRSYLCAVSRLAIGGAQDHKGYAPPFEFLLIANVLVSGNEHIKSSFLSSGQQVTVAERIPAPFFRLNDRVASEKMRDARWSHMIKENEHSPGHQYEKEWAYRGFEQRTQVPS